MWGFGLVICAWTWVSSARTASSTFGVLSGPPSSSGKQSGLLTTDTKRHPALYNAQGFFTKENELTLEDVKRAFCLDLNLGNKFEGLILSELNSTFAETGLYFGSFLLSRCASKLKASNRFPEIFFNYLRREGFDKNVRVIFKDNAGLSEESQNRIIMVLNGVFRKKSIQEREQSFEFETFSVKLAQLRDIFSDVIPDERFINDYNSISSDLRYISKLIYYTYPDVILSYKSREYSGPLAGCFKVMRKAKVSRDIKHGELAEHPVVSEHLNSICEDNKPILADLVYWNVYSAYHDFVWRVFLKSKRQE